MSAYQVSSTAAGPTRAIPINLRKFKYGVGLILTFGAGATGTVNVEVTGDPLNQGAGSQIAGAVVGGAASVGPTNWNKHDTLLSLTASKNSSLAFPVTAVRLNPVSLSGGTVTLSVVEAEG